MAGKTATTRRDARTQEASAIILFLPTGDRAGPRRAASARNRGPQKRPTQPLLKLAEPGEPVPTLRVDRAAASGQIDYSAEAIVLGLEQPSRIVEGCRPEHGHDRLDSGKLSGCRHGHRERNLIDVIGRHRTLTNIVHTRKVGLLDTLNNTGSSAGNYRPHHCKV
jgi:hypothetical protein